MHAVHSVLSLEALQIVRKLGSKGHVTPAHAHVLVIMRDWEMANPLVSAIESSHWRSCGSSDKV